MKSICLNSVFFQTLFRLRELEEEIYMLARTVSAEEKPPNQQQKQDLSASNENAALPPQLLLEPTISHRSLIVLANELTEFPKHIRTDSGLSCEI